MLRLPSQHPLSTCRWFSYAQCSLRPVCVREEFHVVVSSGVSTGALLARVAKSENELIDRVVKPLLALLKRLFSSMLQDVVSEASRLQLGTSRRNTTPRICLCQLQHRIQQRLLWRFLHHWIPRSSFHPQARSVGELSCDVPSPHGTRLIHSLSRCSWVRESDFGLLKTGSYMRPRRRACSLPLVLASDCATELADLMVLSIAWRCCAGVQVGKQRETQNDPVESRISGLKASIRIAEMTSLVTGPEK